MYIYIYMCLFMYMYIILYIYIYIYWYVTPGRYGAPFFTLSEGMRPGRMRASADVLTANSNVCAGTLPPLCSSTVHQPMPHLTVPHTVSMGHGFSSLPLGLTVHWLANANGKSHTSQMPIWGWSPLFEVSGPQSYTALFLQRTSATP